MAPKRSCLAHLGCLSSRPPQPHSAGRRRWLARGPAPVTATWPRTWHFALMATLVVGEELAESQAPTRCRPYEGWSPPKGPYALKTHMEIDEVDASRLTPTVFHDTYVVPNKAVVITNAASNLFYGVGTNWTVEGLLKSDNAHHKQPVRHKHVRLAGCCVDDTKNVSEIFDHPTRTILFQSYPFSMITPGWKVEREEMKLQREYLELLKSNNMLHLEDGHRRVNTGTSTFNLHLSNQGGAIPHSHHATFNACFQGMKRWILVNPLDYPDDSTRALIEQFEWVEWQRSKEGGVGYDSQHWFLNEGEKLLADTGVPFYDFIQEEGDAVFIPDFWMHATMDLCRESVGMELMGDIVTMGYRPSFTRRFKEISTESVLFGYVKMAFTAAAGVATLVYVVKQF